MKKRLTKAERKYHKASRIANKKIGIKPKKHKLGHIPKSLLK